jgi:hypothetical protein
MTRLTLALAAAGLMASAALAQPAPSAGPVIAAERAFSARAADIGIGPSFLEFMSDDAFILAPDPVNARTFYSAHAAGKTPKEGGVLLAWWPNLAGIARSGDLGFTTGPATVNGSRGVFYFTIWVRQADGTWKWIYDGGVDADGAQAPGPEVQPRILPPGDVTPIAPAVALDQVKAAEDALARSAKTNLSMAYLAALAPDARVQGSRLAPATNATAVDAELATRPKAVDFSPLGGGASKSGDLAWTYGDARWADGRGHYVRIWQRRAGAWKLVFDQLLVVDKSKG